ncbi:MAG TPA: GAF domain-containing protein [Vicinamibacterales bacterium]|nr:GAF domain-containing protein [Vicinamibacterales bacterium]
MDTNRDVNLTAWLSAYLDEMHGVAGTVHLHEDGGLRLAAAVNIPPIVCKAVEWVPSGKGMAGLALERGEAVQTCNLKADPSGDVKPGAAAVDAKAAVAMPVRDPLGSIVAVVGIAFADDRQIEREELDRLTRAAESLVT